MGKSAIMAQLALDYEESKEKQQPDALWGFHFCMHTQGRDTPIVAYRSLIAQICEALNLSKKKYISPDINELKDRFEQLLIASKKQLEQQQRERLIIVIDALDEGISFDGDTIRFFHSGSCPRTCENSFSPFE